MSFIVKKFGGTSLSDIKNIRHVASLIYEAYQKGDRSVIVVSAMAGFTNQLVQWTQDVGPYQSGSSEYDVVISSGEQITAGLLALALSDLGVESRSWMGWQLPILTTDHPLQADVVSVDLRGIYEDLNKGVVPIVSGFQGISAQGRLTTLGRGGSDTTAVVLASLLKADACQIFTDVKGVYTADPFYVANAQRYESISYEDMLVFSEHGAKVLHSKAIEWAQKHEVPIQVLSTFNPEDQGTWIQKKAREIKGIAQKSVLYWHLPHLSPQQADELYTLFQQEGVPFFEWKISPKGVQFCAWPEDQKRIQQHLPLGCAPEKMMIITVIGSEETAPYRFSEAAIPIERYFRFPKATGVMVDHRYAHQMLTLLHNQLELHNVI